MTQHISTKTDPREPLHPQVKALLDDFRARRPAERVFDPTQMRAETVAMVPVLTAGAPDVAREEEIRIPGPAGDIRALLFAPENATGKALPILVYLHGGGWVILSPESHAKLTKQFAVGADAIVVSVDYRLAPEYPYPAPLDDCVAAFRWVRENAASLGGDPKRVSIGGDSAGGNLSAATTLRLLAAGEEPPSSVLMICPSTDLAMDTASLHTFAPDDPIIDTTFMEFCRGCYAPNPGQWGDPLLSPLHGDLSAFPPTCVVVGTIDPLCDDGVLFADKLRQSGREVVLQQHEGMPHVFMLFPGIEGERSVAAMCEFLRRSLGP
ncbi:MAG TPA: alpha/beta hydrolase [Dehalococcoidia bacterium]|jgi:acetyl esterase|nr:alpha/beta hydrolase [Dehalococcoidia bacterium]